MPRASNRSSRWLEDYLDESAAERPRSGRVGLQRLNRREYANAVRDLLGVEIDPAAFLPQDDASAGFDNNASTLTASPLFVSQFVDAARLVANLAVGVDTAALGSEVYSSNTGRSRGTRSGRPYEAAALPLGARDGFVVTHAFPVAGEYAVSIEDMVRTISTIGRSVRQQNRGHPRRQDRLRDEHRRRRRFANDRSATDAPASMTSTVG